MCLATNENSTTLLLNTFTTDSDTKDVSAYLDHRKLAWSTRKVPLSTGIDVVFQKSLNGHSRLRMAVMLPLLSISVLSLQASSPSYSLLLNMQRQTPA